MLCPEVVEFPPPKTICTQKLDATSEFVNKSIQRNSFYKSLVITCPDEMKTPGAIENIITEDSDYYRLSECSLCEFVEPNFIENFVNKGNIYCLTADRNCIVQNCAAITPDGVLTLHVLDFIYQSLGLEGTQRPHSYYEVKVDLTTLKQNDKLKRALSKLELFDFYLIWEPHEEAICPSSIARYFYDRNVKVAANSLTLQKVTPDITEVPSIKDVDIEEMVEWVGMLAHEADLNEPETYISTYYPPESEQALQTPRISVLIVRGFIPSSLVMDVCKSLSEYTKSRQLDNYWTSISIQSQENSLWQWSQSTPKMFQAHNSSYNAFFSKDNISVYSLGQLKYL